MIGQALAQEETAVVAGETASAGDAFLWNMGLVLALVLMFYFLMIRPQQKRFAAHKTMLDNLEKGDRVVTAGGLVGTVHKFLGDDEVIVELSEGVHVTAMRNTISSKLEKDGKSAKKAAVEEKKEAAKKKK